MRKYELRYQSECVLKDLFLISEDINTQISFFD